jgi:hypothetical protein
LYGRPPMDNKVKNDLIHITSYQCSSMQSYTLPMYRWNTEVVN